MIPWLCLTARAGVHLIEEGQTVTVPLDPELGTVLQLPGPIKLVTPTAHVLLERIDDGGTQTKGVSTQPVQHLRARLPAGSEPVVELVTIVLGDGAAVPIRLVPTPGADPFADIQRPAPKETQPWGEPGFLQPERELMLAMFRDEPYRREVLDEEQIYEPYPSLAWHLRRRFRGDGLTGYVFVIENRTRKDTLRIDPSVLSVDQPNRAALVSVDDDVLVPCGKKGEGGPCQTVLRLVVRELGAPTLEGPVLSGMPFVKVADGSGRRP